MSYLGKNISELSWNGKVIWKAISDIFATYFHHFKSNYKIQTDFTAQLEAGDVLEIWLKCPFDATSGSLRPWIVGTSVTSTAQGNIILEKSDTNCCIRVYWLDNDRSVTWVVHSLDGTWENEYHHYKIDYGNKKIYCDGVEVTGTMTTGTNSAQNRFGFGRVGVLANSQTWDFMQCKITSSDGTLKKWYVPIVENGKAGVVDIMSGTKTITTYTNMAGDTFEQQELYHKFWLTGIKANDNVRMQYIGCAGDSATVTIDWGDGTEPTVYGNTPSSNIVNSHTYANAGDYVVTVSGDDITWFIGNISLRPVIITGSTAGVNNLSKVVIGKGTGFQYVNSFMFRGTNYTDKTVHLTSLELPMTITSLGKGLQPYNFCTIDKTYLWSQKKMPMTTQFIQAIDPTSGELYVQPWLVQQYKADKAFTDIFKDRIYPFLPEEFN